MKPASNACNIRCTYCYADSHVPSMCDLMSVDLAKKVTKEALIQADSNIEFIWHGGEPFLRGVAFFEEVFAYQQLMVAGSLHLRNALQTNMTLLTDDWLVFLKKWGVQVSTSLDGPDWIHNRSRKNREGVGTHDVVTTNIRRAIEAGIQVNTISVVTDFSADYARDVYLHLAELGVKHVSFLPCYVLGKDGSPVSPTIAPGRFGHFMMEVFDIYLSNFDYPKVREFEQVFRLYTDVGVNVCNYNGTCHKFICVDANGTVFSCDTSPASAEFEFGSISDSSLESVLRGELRKKAIERTDEVHSDCRTCSFWGGCHGGCPNQRPDGKYYFCIDRKTVYSHIESHLAEVIDRLYSKNGGANAD